MRFILQNVSTAHLAAVEEVPDGEHGGQDLFEGLAACQLLHGGLQVEQRFSYFLFQDGSRNVRRLNAHLMKTVTNKWVLLRKIMDELFVIIVFLIVKDESN